jgi:pyruvate,water dikinase
MAVRFPSPYDPAFIIPGTEGWERMYPPGMTFPKDRKEEFEKITFYRHRQHWPRAIKPFDACATFGGARMSLPYYQHRVFMTPNSRGVGFYLLNGYHYACDYPITDPKVIEERRKKMMLRLIFVTQNFDKLHSKWKKAVRALLDEQYSLYDQIQDLPEVEHISHFAEVRGVTSPLRLIELYDRALTLFEKVQYGYQYQFIGFAYGADMAFIEFCRKAFPGIREDEIAKMTTGAELEAFRPDEEVKRLAKLAVKWGLSEHIMKAADWNELRSRFEKIDRGRKWLKEFERSSYPWFWMMVSKGVFPYSDEECWMENPNIILGFLKNYVEKIKKGESIERNLKKLIEEKEKTFKKYYDMLKTDEEKATFMDLWRSASALYVAVEEQILYIKNFNYALFRRNIKKFAEILAKHGVIKEPNDIFYLRFDEIRAALQELAASWGAGEPPTSYFIKEIEWRKEVIKKFEEWEPKQPGFLGPWKKERVIDPFTVLHAGITTERVMEYAEIAEPLARGELTEVRGFPASPGVVEGPARVIKESKDISQLQPGEILVCVHTQPAWTPAFAIIKGVVTDTGGMVSHAAIVSREYGIPAVVGTYVATQAIKTGDWIRVDGSKGVVTILERKG